MDRQNIPVKITTARFVRAVRNFANSETGGRAKMLFAALVLLLCGANGLNVVNSYVGRNFMTSIADRDKAQFLQLAFLYIVVFAASTVVSVIARFAEERLGLLWAEVDALKVANLDLTFSLLLQGAENHKEVPDIHSHLYAVGVGFAVVRSIDQLEVRLHRNGHRKAV